MARYAESTFVLSCCHLNANYILSIMRCRVYICEDQQQLSLDICNEFHFCCAKLSGAEDNTKDKK